MSFLAQCAEIKNLNVILFIFKENFSLYWDIIIFILTLSLEKNKTISKIFIDLFLSIWLKNYLFYLNFSRVKVTFYQNNFQFMFYLYFYFKYVSYHIILNMSIYRYIKRFNNIIFMYHAHK